MDANKRTGQIEKSKMVEDVHTEKDLQRHFIKLSADLKEKYFYNPREIIAFAYIYSTLQIISLEKLSELGKAELKFLNSIHFLNPLQHIPIRDTCFYTFAFSEIGGEINHCLVKR